ncbi:hypothetical protein U9M48_040967 [Paspalum notatum var. saurae]|uniref:Uncharacterized protein n=1 Tax=Paspalum notatum var. saurae TaxID=547442 RepID=A0AAQ3XEB9_PASNO
MLPEAAKKLCNLNILSLSSINISAEVAYLMERLPNCAERKLKALYLQNTRISPMESGPGLVPTWSAPCNPSGLWLGKKRKKNGTTGNRIDHSFAAAFWSVCSAFRWDLHLPPPRLLPLSAAAPLQPVPKLPEQLALTCPRCRQARIPTSPSPLLLLWRSPPPRIGYPRTPPLPQHTGPTSPWLPPSSAAMPRLPPFPIVATPLLCSLPTEHPALLPPDWSSASLPPIHEQQQQ